MDQLQRGVSCIIVALLAAHLANAGAYRAESSGGLSYDEFFGRTLGEEEEPLLKATSPKISITATTNSGAKSAEANGLSGFGGGAGAAGGGAAADAALLTTMVTEFLASTAQTPNKEEGTETVSAGAMEPASSASMEQAAGAAATTTIMPSPSTASAATAAAFHPPTGDDINRRRVITYDQRQEGQYNVRADLENFMIVLIPPTSVSDSLLDLLRKQQQRQSTLTALKRNKLKHHHGSYEHDGGSSGSGSGFSSISSKYPHSSIKIGQSAAAAASAAATNYLTQQQLPQPLRPHYGGAASGYPLMPPLHAMQTTYAEAANSGEAATDKLGSPAEFIEGRTPYRVDISASDDEQSHLHLPERHEQLLQHTHGPAVAAEQSQHVVDVLPPPYTPLAYQHLMKPYLEAEPTFPPSELKRSGIGGIGGGGGSGSHHLTPASGNFLETYAQLLNAGLGGGAELNLKAANIHRGNSLASSARHGGGYYRNARSILGYDFFKGNQLEGSKNGATNSNRYFYPLYRSEHSLGAAQLYPPLDLPRAADDAVASNSAEEPHLHPINADADDQDQEDGEEDVERQQFPHIDDLPLTGYDYDEAMEMQAKKLLERCSPGQRRDSYGQCRKIEGY